MTAPGDLSLSEWVTLAVVTEAPTHGFAIATLTAAGAPLGVVWRVPRPVVYRALERLGRDGLVEPAGTEVDGGPRRRLVRATPSGHEAVDGWLGSPVGHVRDVRTELLVKLALLHRREANPGDLLARQRRALLPIEEALGSRAEADGFDAVLGAWRRANLEAVLRFVAELEDRAGRTTPAPDSPATPR